VDVNSQAGQALRSRFETSVVVALVAFAVAAVLVAEARRVNQAAELQTRQRSVELWAQYQNLNLRFHQSELARDLAGVFSRTTAVDRAEAAVRRAELRLRSAQEQAQDAERNADLAHHREGRLRLGQGALEMALILGCAAIASGRRMLLAAAFASALAGVGLALLGLWL